MSPERTGKYDPNWQQKWPLPESLQSDDFLGWVRVLDNGVHKLVARDIDQWLKEKSRNPKIIFPDEFDVGGIIGFHLVVDNLRPGEEPDNLIKGPWPEPEDSSE